MPVTINGQELLSGVQHMIGNTQIKKIKVFHSSLPAEGVQVYEYDSIPPVLTLNSPVTGQYSLLNKRAYTISGNAIDTESGVASVQLNGVDVPIDSNGNFSVSPNADTNVLVVTDGAGLTAQKTITVGAAEYYDWFTSDRTHTPGNVRDDCWKRCEVCGRRWSWRVDNVTGDWKEGDHAPEHCPGQNNSGYHYKYRIVVS